MVCRDREDDYLLACELMGRADYLVTAIMIRWCLAKLRG